MPSSVPFRAAKLFNDEVSDGITVPVSEPRAVFSAAMPPVVVLVMAPERFVVASLPELMNCVVSVWKVLSCVCCVLINESSASICFQMFWPTGSVVSLPMPALVSAFFRSLIDVWVAFSGAESVLVMVSTEFCALLKEPVMLPAALLTWTASPESCAELLSSAPTSVVEKACDPACVSANSVPDWREAFCAAATVCLSEAVVCLASARIVSDWASVSCKSVSES